MTADDTYMPHKDVNVSVMRCDFHVASAVVDVSPPICVRRLLSRGVIAEYGLHILLALKSAKIIIVPHRIM